MNKLSLNTCVSLCVFILTLSSQNLWANTDCNDIETTGIPAIECSSLLALYADTQGDEWLDNTHWNSNHPVNEWFGVLVENGHVTELKLANNHLRGRFTPDITQLTSLSILSLSDNRLEGAIPENIGALIELRELYVDNNRLNGMLPDSLGQLSHLVWMVFSGNQLSGQIPDALSQLPELRHLMLSFNRFTGSIPASLGHLPHLHYLGLDNNLLENAIPAELGQLSELEHLQLFSNKLTGSLAPELGQLTNLLFFDIDINQVSGEIPPEFGNMSSLTRLDLDHNQLTGSIPPEIGGLVNLTDLYMRHNQLTGEIPDTFSQLVNLQKCFLEENELSGTIPELFFKLPQLRWLRLQSNRFTGNLPVSLGDAPALERLFLQKNKLAGNLPHNLVNLDKLQEFNISYNMLYSTDQAVHSFLQTVSPDWDQTQTLKIENIKVQSRTVSSITVEWDKSVYQPPAGFYRVWLGNTPEGEFVSQGTTENLRSNSFQLTGLQANTTYYVRISSYVPIIERQVNTLMTDSDTLSVTTLVDPNTPEPGCFSIRSAQYQGQPVELVKTQGGLYLSLDEPEGIEEDTLELTIDRNKAEMLSSVKYFVSEGSAYNYSDFTTTDVSGILNFAEQEFEKILPIILKGDAETEEYTEIFRVHLSEPSQPDKLCDDSIEIQIKPSDYPPKMQAETWVLLELGGVFGSFIEGGVAPRKILNMPDEELVEMYSYDGGEFIEFESIAPGTTHFVLEDSDTPANKLFYDIYIGISAMNALNLETPPFQKNYDATNIDRVNIVYPMFGPESDDWLEARHLFFFLLIGDQLLQVQDTQVCSTEETTRCETHYSLTAFNPQDPFFTYRQPSWIMDLKPELSDVGGIDLTQLDFSRNGLNMRDFQVTVFEGFARNEDAFLRPSETLLQRLTWTWYPINIE